MQHFLFLAGLLMYAGHLMYEVDQSATVRDRQMLKAVKITCRDRIPDSRQITT